MAFVPKDWRNATTYAGGGDESTPVTAESLEDLETRVTDYADLASASVMAYGATGDGSTDDTAAFNSIPAGSDIYVPPGTYILSGVALQSGVTLRGAGIGVSILKLPNGASTTAAASGHRVILYNEDGDTGTSGNSDITIHDLEFDGNVANNHAAEWTHCVEFFGVQRVHIHHCYFHDVRGEGVCISANDGDSPHNSDLHLHDIDLYNTGFPTGGSGQSRQGLAVVAGDRINIHDITGYQVDSAVVDLETDNSSQALTQYVVSNIIGYDVEHGVTVIAAANNKATDGHVSNVSVKDGPESATTFGVRLTYVDRCTIDGVTCDTHFYNSAVYAEFSNDLIIQRVNSLGADFAGTGGAIVLDDCDRTLITGCSLRHSTGNQAYAVKETGGSTYTTVRGNGLLQGATAPALLAGVGSSFQGNGEEIACRLKRTSNQTNVLSTTATALSFNVEDADPWSMHDNSTNPSRVTVPLAGYYAVSAGCRWSSTSGTYRDIAIRASGTNMVFHRYGTQAFLSVSGIVKISAGAYIEIFVEQDAGTIDIIADDDYSPRLTVVKIA